MNVYQYTIIQVIGTNSMLVRYNYGTEQESVVSMPLPGSEAELPALIHRYAPEPLGFKPMREGRGAFIPSPGTSGSLVFPTGEEPTLASAKRAKLKELAMWRLGQELSGYIVDGVSYDIHPTARVLLKDRANRGRPAKIKSRDGKFISATVKQLRDIDALIESRISDLDTIEESVQVRIEAAATEAELEMIHLP